jgi:hypothetical protein
MENKLKVKRSNFRTELSFNQWTEKTKFGSLWAPHIDEVIFYQDHEERKKIYEKIKHLPRIDFNEKALREVIVDYVVKVLKL